MNYITIGTVICSLLCPLSLSASADAQRSRILDAIGYLRPAMPIKDALRLETALLKVTATEQCDIPWELLLSIAFHESTLGLNQINAGSGDYGLMQININNIKRKNLSKDKLLADYEYSLTAACNILVDNKARYAKNIPYWIGIYRSGTALWKPAIKLNAKSYDKMVRRVAQKIGYKDPSLQVVMTK